jgi:hypothetical protein
LALLFLFKADFEEKGAVVHFYVRYMGKVKSGLAPSPMFKGPRYHQKSTTWVKPRPDPFLVGATTRDMSGLA